MINAVERFTEIEDERWGPRPRAGRGPTGDCFKKVSEIRELVIRVTMNMPTLDDEAVIPTARESHLSKCLRTTKTLQW